MNLNDLVQENNKKQPPRVLLHSIPGWGKSTLAASAPKPIFLDLEDGLLNIDTPALPPVDTYNAAEEYIRLLIKEKHDYKIAVLDSLSVLEKLINKKVCKDNNVDSVEKIGYGKGRVFAMTYWEKIITGLDILRKKKNMIIMLLAHSTVKIFNSPIVESYDKYFLTIHKLPANFITSWTDFIFFGDHKIFVQKNKEGFKETTKGIGAGERIIYTEERPAFLAKSKKDMPYEIEIPKKNGWNAISKYL